MISIILSIGDELVLGQTVDTNSAWLSAQLAAMGCDVAAHATVPDDQTSIESAIQAAAGRSDLLIVSGGLGPTADDLTRQALAAVLGRPLEINAAWLENLEAFFAQRRRPMPQSNRVQAMIPAGARILENTAGTAPGIDADFHPPGAKPCRIFAIPGVPREMKLMFERQIAPHIAAAGRGAVILSRTLHTFGLGESSVAQRLEELMDRRRNPSVGTTVSDGQVSLRINARFEDRARAQTELDSTTELCRRALGDLIFGQDDQTLPGVIGDLLLASQFTVATAESCTGGLLAKMITDIPGSSRYFQRGWITYSNAAKGELLGVPAELLAQHGAVSEPVAIAMADGARQRGGATFALSITGIAGPDGGSPQKPVGTVCIGIAGANPTVATTYNFPGDRESIRDRSAKMALTLLRYQILGKSAPF
jgi:nicotinamide-nucleotide amidase